MLLVIPTIITKKITPRFNHLEITFTCTSYFSAVNGSLFREILDQSINVDGTGENTLLKVCFFFEIHYFFITKENTTQLEVLYLDDFTNIQGYSKQPGVGFEITAI